MTRKNVPCAPTCNFNGKEIPGYCDWSENGSITSSILANILQPLDKYGVCDRKNSVKPFLLLDGHGSHFKLPFLDYICDPKHEWVVLLACHTALPCGRVGTHQKKMVQ